ncbi:PIN domain-containing protein [Streptomyces sp. NPDC046977]|uniref:type II toxin-antitoxin system VapC family toxin n=1 Tax=Streptomyces sp. NPDC046977 TaxID=3154703 RepID=UPI003402280B
MRPERPKSVYLDACCYIDWATGQYSGTSVETWLRAARAEQLQIYASTLLLAEARGGSRAEPNPAAERQIRNLLSEPYVTLVDVSRRVGLLARDLIVDYPKVRNWDAVHMASAVAARADVFLTRNVNDFTPGMVHRGVWVDEPYEFGGEGLFLLPGLGEGTEETA